MTRQARDHTHLPTDIIDPATDLPAEGGDGEGVEGAYSLEDTLAAGNTTGENIIVGPSDTYVGSASLDLSNPGEASLAGGTGVNDGDEEPGGESAIRGGTGTTGATGAQVVAEGGGEQSPGTSGGLARVIGGDAGATGDGGDVLLTPGLPGAGGRNGQVILGGQLTTGENTIVMPMGTIDGTTAEEDLALVGQTPETLDIGSFIAVDVYGDGYIIGGGFSGGQKAQVEVDAALDDGTGGTVSIYSGLGKTASGKDGGDIKLIPSAGDGAGRNGQVILGGTLNTGENTIVMPNGVIDGVSGDGIYIEADPAESAEQGNLALNNAGAFLNAGFSAAGDGGQLSINKGNVSSGGTIVVQGGDAGSASDASGGDITLTPGAGDGAGRHGLVFLNLPTADPAVAGALWADSLVVKVSAG